VAKLGLELRRVQDVFHGVFQFQQRGHEQFGDKLPA